MPLSEPAYSPIWHPFTQHAISGPAIEIERGEGATLITRDGRRILDAISSWWVNTHGHGHPRIARAVAAQAARLEQVIFAGFTHQPAEQLARKLLTLAPKGLEFAFFSDSGSTAVEVGLKMAIGYGHNLGRPRSRVVAFDHGYHGDTFGAMSVGGRGVFSAAYRELLFDVDFLPFPERGHEHRTIEAFATLLRGPQGDSIAALLIEPLVLGAGGMLMYPPWVLTGLAELCRRHDVFLIVDEVMTGFGRTGSLFACEQAGVAPDVMCLSKGITGGFLAMGVTLATRRLYEAYLSDDRGRMFFHSSSYTGNPIACAAAVANLEIWDSEPVPERIGTLADHHKRRLEAYAGRDDVRDVRQCGTIAALTLADATTGYLSGLAPRLYRFFLERDVLLRPLGNVVYLMPPYCIHPYELDRIYDVIDDALAALRNRSL